MTRFSSDPTEQSEQPECPLCQLDRGEHFYRNGRDYFQCPICELAFVSPHQFLSLSAEKEIYEHHQNSPADQNYRDFLGRLFRPMQLVIPRGSQGLDFGSGPGPTLSVMFSEAGHQMEIYDPFYAPDETRLERDYDFISSSEVVEHFCSPRKEFDRIWNCLKPRGCLGIMTKRFQNRLHFENWHYHRDPTHVSFYAEGTFRWLAAYWDAELVIPHKEVVLFFKTSE